MQTAMKRLELTRKGILQAFFDCSHLSWRCGSRGPPLCKALWVWGLPLHPGSIFSLWLSEIRKASPYGQAEPEFLLLPTPGDDSWKQWWTILASECLGPAAPWLFWSVGPGAGFGALPRAFWRERFQSNCLFLFCVTHYEDFIWWGP